MTTIADQAYERAMGSIADLKVEADSLRRQLERAHAERNLIYCDIVALGRAEKGAECMICGAMFSLAEYGDYYAVGSVIAAHFATQHPELGSSRSCHCECCGRLFTDSPDVSAVQHAAQHRTQQEALR